MPEAKPIVVTPLKPKKTYTYNEEDIKEFALAATKGVRADLVGGKVPSDQLPSYVDDVIEGYYYDGAFYSDADHQHEINGEEGKIYVDLPNNTTYRWSGTQFIKVDNGGISDGVAYTTTAPTAANPYGLKVVVLDEEPATKYDGWLYIITGA